MDHEQIKDNLSAFHDGQLPPEDMSIVESHLAGCAECRQWLDGWKRTSAAFLQPLKVDASEVFVQQVMRRVRTYEEQDDWVRWPVFARWAFPALALSVASFTLALSYVSQPAGLTTDAVLLEEQASNLSTEWLSTPPNEDQILSSVVAPQ